MLEYIKEAKTRIKEEQEKYVDFYKEDMRILEEMKKMRPKGQERDMFVKNREKAIREKLEKNLKFIYDIWISFIKDRESSIE